MKNANKNVGLTVEYDPCFFMNWLDMLDVGKETECFIHWWYFLKFLKKEVQSRTFSIIWDNSRLDLSLRIRMEDRLNSEGKLNGLRLVRLELVFHFDSVDDGIIFCQKYSLNPPERLLLSAFKTKMEIPFPNRKTLRTYAKRCMRQIQEKIIEVQAELFLVRLREKSPLQ